MNKSKLASFIFLLSLVCVGVGVIWGVVIYFDNWNRIISDKKYFDLARYPVIFMLIALVLQGYANIIKKEL